MEQRKIFGGTYDVPGSLRIYPGCESQVLNEHLLKALPFIRRIAPKLEKWCGKKHRDVYDGYIDAGLNFSMQIQRGEIEALHKNNMTIFTLNTDYFSNLYDHLEKGASERDRVAYAAQITKTLNGCVEKNKEATKQISR